jgi:hypothetical protein
MIGDRRDMQGRRQVGPLLRRFAPHSYGSSRRTERRAALRPQPRAALHVRCAPGLASLGMVWSRRCDWHRQSGRRRDWWQSWPAHFASLRDSLRSGCWRLAWLSSWSWHPSIPCARIRQVALGQTHLGFVGARHPVLSLTRPRSSPGSARFNPETGFLGCLALSPAVKCICPADYPLNKCRSRGIIGSIHSVEVDGRRPSLVCLASRL